MRCVSTSAGRGQLLMPDYIGWPGGHGESLRRSRGDAAGAELATQLLIGLGERGNRPWSPVPARLPARQREGTRRLTAPGWGGGPVVVAGVNDPSLEAGKAGRRAKGASRPAAKEIGMPGGAPVNTGNAELDLVYFEAERRVLEIQAKLHRWAS